MAVRRDEVVPCARDHAFLQDVHKGMYTTHLLISTPPWLLNLLTVLPTGNRHLGRRLHPCGALNRETTLPRAGLLQPPARPHPGRYRHPEPGRVLRHHAPAIAGLHLRVACPETPPLGDLVPACVQGGY